MEQSRIYRVLTLVSLMGVLLFGVLLVSCSSYSEIESGSYIKYRPGHPLVHISAMGLLTKSNHPAILLTANIDYASLAYKKGESISQARLEFNIHIEGQEENDSFDKRIHYNITIAKNDKSKALGQSSYVVEKKIDVPTGRYKVYFTVTDLHTDKATTRVVSTAIPDTANKEMILTDIRMLGKIMDVNHPRWTPINTYSVPGNIDSLMFIFQATNKRQLILNATLLRFRGDLSIARPMHYNEYSIQYRGINYDEKKVIQQQQRTLVKADTSFIAFKFAPRGRGNYRVKITAQTQGNTLFKIRDFSIRNMHFPFPKTARERVRPLAYLMSPQRYEAMIALTNSDSLNKAIDHFWNNHFDSKYKAEKVRQLYYQRVIEANKRFSNSKMGWKTDRGMIYILFGPPCSKDIDTRFNNDSKYRLVWYYYDVYQGPTDPFFFGWRSASNPRFWAPSIYWGSDIDMNYGGFAVSFFRPSIKYRGEYVKKLHLNSFQYYLLYRPQGTAGYYPVQYQQRKRWLSGEVLQDRPCSLNY